MTALRAYLQLMRAPALFTAVSNVTAAHLIATGGAVEWRVWALLCVASAAFLAAGMILNDCFDYAVDARERPSRPLPSGRIALERAWLLGFALAALGVALAAAADLGTLYVAVGLVATILLYDGALKSTWLGPFAMGLCRYLNWSLPLAAASVGLEMWLIPIPVLVYIAAVTVLSRAEVAATQAQRSLVTLAALLLIGAALAIVLLWWRGVLGNVWVLPLTALALAIALRRLLQVHRQFSAPAVQHTVRFLLFGIIPLDALLAIGAGVWPGALILLLMLPSRWLGRRMYVT
jgi:4-hydroxybenzoate polyprenyltransferase